MIFHHPQRVEFNHCDPAGIVFYPRYFEMLNSTCENFFREVVGHSYAAMMAQRTGTPTVTVTTTFHAPSRLEEMLDWRLQITRLGTSSVSFQVTAHCDNSHRLTADLTLVYVTAERGPQPWPPETRARLAAFLAAP